MKKNSSLTPLERMASFPLSELFTIVTESQRQADRELSKVADAANNATHILDMRKQAALYGSVSNQLDNATKALDILERLVLVEESAGNYNPTIKLDYTRPVVDQLLALQPS